jgi:alpha 1,2-mannosyltransferase
MRRPASSALPSYAPEGRRAVADSAPTATTAHAGRSRWWLLFYVVLGFYALTVLSSFVVGWAPEPSTQLQQQVQHERPQVLQHLQKVVVAGPIKVETTAKDPHEPEEGWPVKDSGHGEEEGDVLRGLGQEQRGEEEHTAAAADEVAAPDIIEKAAETPTATDATAQARTTAPATTSPSIKGVQSVSKKDVEIPTRQSDVVLLAANEEEQQQETMGEDATTQPDDMNVPTNGETDVPATLKDPNEAEAEMQAPQEKWEVEDAVKNEATETPRPLSTPESVETRPPVRRSQEFFKAMDLVHIPETKPPNPYFHVFPVSKNAPGNDATLLAGLRNDAADRDSWTVEGYQHELDRLEGLKREANEETERLKLLVAAADKLIVEEKDRLEEKRAASTLDIRLHQPRKIRNNLKCMGWRQTGQCSPYGKREPNSDLACNQIAQGGVSGYCEVLDQDTGELFRVMQLNCSSVRDHVVFSCAEAADFANFGLMAQNVFESAQAQNAAEPLKLLGNTGKGNGIVMVVYPKLLTSAFASISVLRSYNCTLPIELWISQPEVVRTPSMRTTLDMLQQRFSNVTVETIIDPTVAGFSTKIHAVQHSKFENVLFLDADNVPVRDPTFLFESQEFREHGAIFWPDFWHPEKTIFNIQRDSLLWELVDLPFVDMFEQESGQILINRKRAAEALEVLMFFAYHRPSHFERLVLAHGDKDLFRLAWMKTHTPYYMMPFPPAAAGTERGTYKKQFCGMTMVQFDIDGNVLFLHRNAKKLDGKVDKLDPTYWTHLQVFKWEQDVGVGDGEDIVFPANRPAVQRLMSYEDIKQKYQIGIQPSGVLFKEFESCYGAEANVVDNFNLTKFEDLPFANLEQHLIDYAHEAALLMAQAQGRMGVVLH